MSETTPETPESPAEPVTQAPELASPVGADGPSLMGVAPWPQNAPEPAPVPASPVTAGTEPTPAELRVLAEQLLAAADKIDSNQGM